MFSHGRDHGRNIPPDAGPVLRRPSSLGFSTPGNACAALDRIDEALFPFHQALVADQEGVTRGLLDFRDLEWDDRRLRFHES